MGGGVCHIYEAQSSVRKKREKQSIDKSYKLHRLPRDRNFMKTKETFLICLLEYFKGNHWKHKDFFSHGIFYHCPHQISCSQSPKERLSCLYTEIVFFSSREMLSFYLGIREEVHNGLNKLSVPRILTRAVQA